MMKKTHPRKKVLDPKKIMNTWVNLANHCGKQHLNCKIKKLYTPKMLVKMACKLGDNNQE